MPVEAPVVVVQSDAGLFAGSPGASTRYRKFTYDTIGRKAADVVKVGATTKYDAAYTYDANSNLATENVKSPKSSQMRSQPRWGQTPPRDSVVRRLAHAPFGW